MSTQVSTHHCNNLANSLSLPKVSPSISLFTFYCFALFALKSSLLHFLHQMQISKNIYIRQIDKKEKKRKKRKQIPSILIPMKREKKRKNNMILIIEKIQNILTLMKCVCIICFTSKHTIYLHKCVHAYKSAIYVC